jgi:hypothetical protein
MARQAKINIVPQRAKFFNRRRVEQIDKKGSRSTYAYDEICNIAIKNRGKMQIDNTIDLMIDMLPTGVRREIFFLILKSGTKNILIDTTNKKMTYTNYLAKMFNVDESLIRREIKFFTDRNWLYKVNKYILFVNPFYYSSNRLSNFKLEQLQDYWDALTNEDKSKRPKEAFQWKDKIEVEELVKTDLKEIHDNIEKSQKEVRKTKQMLQENIVEDTNEIANNFDIFKKTFDSFTNYYNYTEIKTKQLTHFRNWLKSNYKKKTSFVQDLPILHCTSIKPFKQLI